MNKFRHYYPCETPDCKGLQHHASGKCIPCRKTLCATPGCGSLFTKRGDNRYCHTCQRVINAHRYWVNKSEIVNDPQG